MSEARDLIASLREFGLTEYEARVYLSLLSNGPMKVSEIAKETGVPRTKVYEAIKGLKRKGLLETFGKPLKCRPLSFEASMGKIIEMEEKRLKALKDALLKVKEYGKTKVATIKVEEGSFQMIYPESVVNKLREMIENTRGYFHALIDSWGLKLLQDLTSHILTLLLTDVDVKIVLSYKDQESVVEGGKLPFSFKVGPVIDGRNIFMVDDKLLLIVDSGSGIGYFIKMPEIVTLIERYIFLSSVEMAVDLPQYMRLMSIGMAEELPFLKGDSPLYRFFVEAVFDELSEEALWRIGQRMYEKMTSAISSHLFNIRGDAALSAWSELIASSLEGRGKVRYDNITKMMMIEWNEEGKLPYSLWMLAFVGYLRSIGKELRIVSRLSEGNNQIIQLKVPWTVLEEHERF